MLFYLPMPCILNGVIFQIDVEKLAGFLPLHLIAVLVSSNKDESLLRYSLCGIRLLHSLCDLAPRHTKLEQVAFNDPCIRFLFGILYSGTFLFVSFSCKDLRQMARKSWMCDV